MNYTIGAKCSHCNQEWLPNQFQYQCPKCGGNLSIQYDYYAIRQKNNRDILKENRDCSIWRYEFLLPVANHGSIPLQIGWTPLYHIQPSTGPNFIDKDKHLGWSSHLYIKDDGRNPSASFKDRASAITLLHAKSIHAQKITGASTGNAGSSMACLCASVGMPLVIFVPEKAPMAKVAQLSIFGSQVITVKGTYDDAFNLCLEVSKKFGWYSRNTGYNPYTREGKKTCAFEICEQLSWKAPDWVLVSVGDGNILSGVWKGFSEMYKIGWIDRMPKMLGIQSEQSSAIYQSWQNFQQTGKMEVMTTSATTIADSISVDLPRDGLLACKAIAESHGDVITVSDAEILRAISYTGHTWGIFAEPAGAASMAGFFKAQHQGLFHDQDTVVSIITGNGLKDVNSAIKAATPPALIEPNLQAFEAYIQHI